MIFIGESVGDTDGLWGRGKDCSVHAPVCYSMSIIAVPCGVTAHLEWVKDYSLSPGLLQKIFPYERVLSNNGENRKISKDNQRKKRFMEKRRSGFDGGNSGG